MNAAQAIARSVATGLSVYIPWDAQVEADVCREANAGGACKCESVSGGAFHEYIGGDDATWRVVFIMPFAGQAARYR